MADERLGGLSGAAALLGHRTARPKLSRLAEMVDGPNPKPQIQSPKAEPESRAERTGDSWRTRARWDPQEILNQIRLTRKQPGASGHIHWNMKSLMRSSALDEALEREVYTQPALVPASPWLDNARPEKPRLTAGKADRSAALSVSWAPSVAGKAWRPTDA